MKIQYFFVFLFCFLFLYQTAMTVLAYQRNITSLIDLGTNTFNIVSNTVVMVWLLRILKRHHNHEFKIHRQQLLIQYVFIITFFFINGLGTVLALCYNLVFNIYEGNPDVTDQDHSELDMCWAYVTNQTLNDILKILTVLTIP